VREILGGDPAVFLTGPSGMTPLPVDGAEHLRRRRLLLPPLHGERLAAWADPIDTIAEREVATWPDSSPVALQPAMERVTLDVILRTLLGPVEGRRMEQIRGLMRRLLWMVGSGVGAANPMRTRLLEATSTAPRTRVLRRVDRLLDEEIAARRAAGPEPNHDVLSMLSAQRDDSGDPLPFAEIRASLHVLLTAGHHTTAATLSWACYELAHDPVAMERAAEDEAFRSAVVTETLRLRPALPLAGRRLADDVEVTGRRLPAGTLAAPCLYLLHREPELYRDPRRFLPERFLGAAPAPYAWAPFGGGTRRCPGAGFAVLEATRVLGAVLRQRRLRPAETRREPVRRLGMSLVPAHGGRVVAQARC
jgi:cytochrome P450